MNSTTPTPSPSIVIKEVNHQRSNNNRNMLIAGSLLTSFFVLYNFYKNK